MKTLEQSNVNKSTWGDGPWQSEPDKVQWQDIETKLPCLIVRNQFGALCGYVGISKTHPYYGRPYNKVGDGLQVHGGLTFSDKCHSDGTICHTVEDGEDDNVWWLGFDCGHAFDLCPSILADLRRNGANLSGEFSYGHHDTYRDIAYVRSEVARLAKQLAALA